MTTKFYQKWDPAVFGYRLKYNRALSGGKWGLSENIEQELIRLADRELTRRGIPGDKWPLYEGLAARGVQRHLMYSGRTLSDALDLLVDEHVRRGQDSVVCGAMVGISGWIRNFFYGYAWADFCKADHARTNYAKAYRFYTTASAVNYAFCEAEE